MSKKICCITGHRDVPKEKIEYVKQELRKEISEAIKDGYILFVSGFASGTDLLFAGVVVEYMDMFSSIELEAALPYRKWINRADEPFPELLKRCTMVSVLSDEYTPQCFMKRNRYMVDISNRVIAVFDGRTKGGTYNTVSYAERQKKEIRTIKI